MKKILIILFIGLGLNSFSISTKANNRKNVTKKVSTKSSDFKNKVNNSETLNKIIGPRYKIDGSLGIINSRYVQISNNNDAKKFISLSAGFSSEWKTIVNKNFDITFGPKITLNVYNYSSGNSIGISHGLILGVVSDFNYRLIENFKLYTGIEFGIGGGIKILYPKLIPNGENLLSIAKISLGFKLNDKYNVGFYVGNVKGLVGIEAGYTF
ncbi:hypothetical protein [Streptobacillus notomytis]|uniref:hypothetical protein n=1 Tax=Streptobacillus notomytis TaxID=1712031 RepID=UPI000ACDD66B|nr:hypothetical protein [Streptobacillus notomytis]